MKTIVVVGAGSIGSAIAKMLQSTNAYCVGLVDGSQAALDRSPKIPTVLADAADQKKMSELLRGSFAVINAAPWKFNDVIAAAAADSEIHYLDMTEDCASARRTRGLPWPESACIPQCGLAPGYASILAAHVAKELDAVDTIRIRVGAIPLYPRGQLGYALNWNVDGLINEYIKPCDAVVDYVPCKVAAMADLERILIGGTEYEAFNTSGGLGTLYETMAGVRNLNYKTLRYPGHHAAINLLLNELSLKDRPVVLRDILTSALPSADDVVIVLVSASGNRNGRYVEESISVRIEGRDGLSAIQRATASATCAVLDLLAQGALPGTGVIRQEDIDLADFENNRFGYVYGGDSR